MSFRLHLLAYIGQLLKDDVQISSLEFYLDNWDKEFISKLQLY